MVKLAGGNVQYVGFVLKRNVVKSKLFEPKTENETVGLGKHFNDGLRYF